jgi:hypothetical protein
MTDLPLVKICERCELDFRRPTGTGRISDERWAARRFCSASCGMLGAGMQPGDLNPSAQSAFDPARVAAVISSAALKERLFRVYHRIAAERGLNDEWEAAVVLGMAA